MSYQDTSPPPLPHSNDLEHRLTKLELQGHGHGQKLALHEKAILAIASAVYLIAQDRFPQVAAIIRSVLIP